jgi:hypothetical protein
VSKRLWSVRVIYERAPHEAGLRTGVIAAPNSALAIAWLKAEVKAKRELPGYRVVDGHAEDITDIAIAFAQEKKL